MSLSGYKIEVSEFMAGCKRAVKQGGTIYLSPAMYDLVSHAEGEELGRLLAAIPLLDIGEPLDFFADLPPMTSSES